MSDKPEANAAIEAGQRRPGTIRLGLIATPGVAHDLARDIAAKLPEALRGEASSAVEWEVPWSPMPSPPTPGSPAST